jgi:hypothetical protein
MDPAVALFDGSARRKPEIRNDAGTANANNGRRHGEWGSTSFYGLGCLDAK